MSVTDTPPLQSPNSGGTGPDDRVSPSPTNAGAHGGVRGLLERHALLLLLIAVAAFFSVNPASGDIFFTQQNASVLLGNQATVALLALAVILPLVCGYFDFSLGAIAASSPS
jgi:ABC-type xylose transport system permease subunit